MDPQQKNIILEMELKVLEKRRTEIIKQIKLNKEIIKSYAPDSGIKKKLNYQ